MKAMLSNENTTVYIIPHQGTSFTRIDGAYSIQDMSGQDGSKPQAVSVSLVQHSGINSTYVTVNPEGRKDYQTDIKLDGADLTSLDDVLSEKCIVCVPYNDVETIVYGLGGELSWDSDEQKFWSDSEVEPIKMRTEHARNWDR